MGQDAVLGPVGTLGRLVPQNTDAAEKNDSVGTALCP